MSRIDFRGTFCPLENKEIDSDGVRMIKSSDFFTLTQDALVKKNENKIEYLCSSYLFCHTQQIPQQIGSRIVSKSISRYFAHLKNEAILAPFFASNPYCYTAKNSSHKRKKPYLT